MAGDLTATDLARARIDEVLAALVDAGAEAALSTLLAAAAQVMSARESSILMPQDDDHLKFHASTNPDILGPDIPMVPIGASVAGVVYLTGQTMAYDEAQDHFAGVDEKLGYATKEYLAVPVIGTDAAIGVLTFVNRPEGQGPFAKADIMRAEAIAQLCDPLIDHARRAAELGEATAAAFRRRVDGSGGRDGPAVGDGSGDDSVRGAISTALTRLDADDLDLVRDLVERLGASPAGDD